MVVREVERVQPEVGSRGRRRAAIGLLGFAALLSLLGVLLFVAGMVEDAAIENHTGRAEADVVGVSATRTLVRFQTPDGAEHVPGAGVMYPEALAEGQVVRVEYDQRNPDLVRVAGRGAALMALPVLSLLALVWALVLSLVWWLRQRGPLDLRPLRRRI